MIVTSPKPLDLEALKLAVENSTDREILTYTPKDFNLPDDVLKHPNGTRIREVGMGHYIIMPENYERQ